MTSDFSEAMKRWGRDENTGNTNQGKSMTIEKHLRMIQAELIQRIQKAEGNFDCFGTATVINLNVVFEKIV